MQPDAAPRIPSLVIQVRGMSEGDFGLYSLLYTFIPVIGTLLSLGLEQVMQRYQPEYLRAGNRLGAAWLMRTVAASRLAANILIIIVVLLCWNLVAPLFKLTAYRGTFAVFSFVILLQFQSRILQLALARSKLSLLCSRTVPATATSSGCRYYSPSPRTVVANPFA